MPLDDMRTRAIGRTFIRFYRVLLLWDLQKINAARCFRVGHTVGLASFHAFRAKEMIRLGFKVVRDVFVVIFCGC